MRTYSYKTRTKYPSLSLRLLGEVDTALKNVHFSLYVNCAAELRRAILLSLHRSGWSDEVMVNPRLRITITSIRRDVGLCLQTGNMGRFYADLLKLQCLHSQERIASALYIVPTKEAAKIMGSNVANYERLINELGVFKAIITVPIIVVGIE